MPVAPPPPAASTPSAPVVPHPASKTQPANKNAVIGVGQERRAARIVP